METSEHVPSHPATRAVTRDVPGPLEVTVAVAAPFAAVCASRETNLPGPEMSHVMGRPAVHVFVTDDEQTRAGAPLGSFAPRSHSSMSPGSSAVRSSWEVPVIVWCAAPTPQEGCGATLASIPPAALPRLVTNEAYCVACRRHGGKRQCGDERRRQQALGGRRQSSFWIR